MPGRQLPPDKPHDWVKRTTLFDLEALPGATFGGQLRLHLEDIEDLARVMTALKADPDLLAEAFYARDGLLVLPGMNAISTDPSLLVELSSLFGPEVENYQHTLTAERAIHPSVPEIFQVTNLPPTSRQPPKKPEPVLTEDGALPTQFPHRRGWHTDQSFRRPPPDVSLFYAVIPSPQGQGQTLYADGAGAYEALTDELKDM
ncbi:MAG: TauD/TfdA family dioxygenase, partial [Pseudomonadota bacterium]|nr:TauD/TfdA family dioxygenase [Pseudomonadota bacterium]